jgi:cellulose synthase/poly-beta-1,6-N-acetylglucosamine synthase-like glycosyltransferase
VICAYNEARALPDLLEALGHTNVLVVDDGSSDGTGRLAATEGAVVLTHRRRMGKAASLQDAIDYALDNGYGIVVEMGADSLPEKGAIERLVRPLSSPAVGGASVRQIPVGLKKPSYFIDELIWSVLSHGKSIQMARHGTSHLGGVMYAFKPECVSSVEGSVNDDEHLSVCIKSKGYKTVFVPSALVYFDASSSIGHILQRRRRMYYGHMVYPESTAPSMEIAIVASALLRSVAERPSRLPWTVPAVLLDVVSRMRAWKDGRSPKKRGEYAMWVTTFEKNMVSGALRGNR